jgi:TonB family protein
MAKTLRWIALLVMGIASGSAQESKVALPMVAGAAVPLYPPLARAARIQGVVHIEIVTDGHNVITARVKDGQKLLAAAAEENARTWRFAVHTPTSFTITYRYKLDVKLNNSPNNPTIVLRLPTEVEVSSAPMPPLDTAGSASPPKDEGRCPPCPEAPCTRYNIQGVRRRGVNQTG